MYIILFMILWRFLFTCADEFSLYYHNLIVKTLFLKEMILDFVNPNLT